MSFNWQMAGAGLLGEAGRQADIAATRMSKLEEKQLEEQKANRREKAKLLREKSLKTLGYTKEGTPVTQEQYEAAETKPILYEKGLEREKKAEPKDARGETGKKFDDLVRMYGKERALAIMEEDRISRNTKGKGGTEKKGGLSDDKKISYIQPRREEYAQFKQNFEEERKTPWYKKLFGAQENTDRPPSFKEYYQTVAPDEFAMVYGGESFSPSMEFNDTRTDADKKIDEILGIGPEETKPPLAVTGLLGGMANAAGIDGKEAVDSIKQGSSDVIAKITTGSVSPGDIVNMGVKGASALKDAIQWAGEKQGAANDAILEMNRLAGEGTVESVSKVLKWIKDTMTADIDKKAELKSRTLRN